MRRDSLLIIAFVLLVLLGFHYKAFQSLTSRYDPLSEANKLISGIFLLSTAVTHLFIVLALIFIFIFILDMGDLLLVVVCQSLSSLQTFSYYLKCEVLRTNRNPRVAVPVAPVAPMDAKMKKAEQLVEIGRSPTTQKRKLFDGDADTPLLEKPPPKPSLEINTRVLVGVHPSGRSSLASFLSFSADELKHHSFTMLAITERGKYSRDTLVCFDSKKQQITIPNSQINDDYCDCFDGTDEPGLMLHNTIIIVYRLSAVALTSTHFQKERLHVFRAGSTAKQIPSTCLRLW